MNILIPHSWLLEHLDTAATPGEIQKHLSLCGPSIERIYDHDGESVYDIEVTTNRVDMMSVRGIAREAAVILPQFGIAAQLKPLHIPALTQTAGTTSVPLPQIHNNHGLCQRITCVVLDQVAHTPTPAWMAERLKLIDQNVHDSVIDITNYVTHDLGHPCHAFDYDRIMQLGGAISVVEAQPGQPFTTLDGVAYTTKGGEVVFTNPSGSIIDLPAIKGTANTAVTDQTTRILFWIESIDAKKIRTASMAHAIRTVAAQLNEKNVDPHLADEVLARGAELYQQLCGATVSSPVFDEFPGERTPATIPVKLDHIAAYLGLTIPTPVLTALLTNLGCSVETTDRQLVVTPPTYRPDLAIPADVIEEIARIYGYHRLPSILMPTAIPVIKPSDSTFDLEDRVKAFLAGLGWQEVYTYSMVSAALATQSGYSLEKHLKLANPLTDDRVYLRRSLLPSLHEVILNQPQKKQWAVFEMAAVYEPKPANIPEQPIQLALVTTQPYRTVRGGLEALLRYCFVTEVQIEPTATAAVGFHQSARITATTATGERLEIGQIGLIETDVIAVSIGLAELRQVTRSNPSYQPLPKTAPIIEDLTFTIPESVPVGHILTTISAAHPLLQKVELKTIYERNFTFTLTYWDSNHSLSTSDVEPARRQAVATATHQPGVSLVGSI